MDPVMEVFGPYALFYYSLVLIPMILGVIYTRRSKIDPSGIFAFNMRFSSFF